MDSDNYVEMNDVCNRINQIMNPIEDQRRFSDLQRMKDQLKKETSDTYGYLKELYLSQDPGISSSLKVKISRCYQRYHQDQEDANNYYKVGPRFGRNPIQLDLILYAQYMSDLKRLRENRWLELIEQLVDRSDIITIFKFVNKLKYRK